MYVVLTVGNMYYDEPMYTFPDHASAFTYGAGLGGWFDIERVR